MSCSDLTVAICTWNRANLLEQTLSRMCSLRVPEGRRWELLVVNNNCTDETDEVLAQYAETLPLRRLFERKPGQSNARNCAVEAARGELIIWTDDDVLVSEEWLAEYVAAAERWPNAEFFGGPIEPWFVRNSAPWLERVCQKVGSAYALRDFGDTPMALAHPKVPYGANFAVRTEAQKKYLYDPEIGLRPNSTMRGDEVTVLRQMQLDGCEGRWVPGARVRHYIPEDRQTTRYLRKFYFGHGQLLARDAKKSSKNLRCLFGRPRWMWRHALESEIRYRWRRCVSPPEVWIEDLIRASTAWGRLRGSE